MIALSTLMEGDQGIFKDLIVNLAKRKKVYEKFNSQAIANTFNALSKWDVLDNQEFKDSKGEFKSLIVKLIKQGNTIDSTKFNSQNIANILNALSKWDVLDTEIEQVSKEKVKSFIVKLIDQGNQTTDKFNSQDIANILNALSKWDVLDTEIEQVSKEKVKSFIVKLIDQGNQITDKFNSQGIANILDALYKFSIFDNKWSSGEQGKFKALISNLAQQGNKIDSKEFNSQGIANIFNTFSKLDVLDDNKWTSDKQEAVKSLIVKLANMDEIYKNYNLKDISGTYMALYKWDVLHDDKFDSSAKSKFKGLISKLEDRVLTIAEKQSVVEPGVDIRFASQIINDLPKLKSENLITSEGKLLVPLMECLSTSIDKSEASDLKENWPKKNIVSGLEGFANIVDELEDKSSLKGEFDQSLIKIFKKLFAVELGSEYKKEEIINKLIRLEVIKDKDALQELLVDQSGDKVLERKEENKPGGGATLPVQPFSVKDGSISGSSQLPKKQEKEEEMKLPIGRGRSNVGQSKEDDQPGTALSGATISNRSPKAKT